MNLHIRQRIFSWTDSYEVCDEEGMPRYEVRSALFSLGHQIHVYDLNADEKQEEVGCIREKFFSLLPAFEIVIGGKVMGIIRRKATLFLENYEVDYLGWDVEGNCLGWDYRVVHQGREILSISKKLLSWSDTYALSYADPKDEIPGLMLVLAIDAANCAHND